MLLQPIPHNLQTTIQLLPEDKGLPMEHTVQELESHGVGCLDLLLGCVVRLSLQVREALMPFP